MKLNLTTIKSVIAIVATTIVLAACNSSYEKSPSGMAYKITHGNGKAKIKQGEIVKFYIEYKLQDKDTILNSNFGKMPAYVPVDTNKLPKHNFTEIITKLSVGDKVDFILSIDTLKSLGQIQAYDNIFKKGGLIKGKIEILKTFANDSLTRPDYQEEQKKDEIRMNASMQKEMKEKEVKNKALLESQTKALKAYAEKNKIKYITSPLGVLVEVQNEGVGVKAVDGYRAMLLYKGYLTNGTVFDANMGKDAKHTDPIDVSVGSHNTIPGFEDAMKYFGKGGKGRLLIPSVLGYGDRSGPGLPANSNLIFDIEVKDVIESKPATSSDSSKNKK